MFGDADEMNKKFSELYGSVTELKNEIVMLKNKIQVLENKFLKAVKEDEIEMVMEKKEKNIFQNMFGKKE